MMKMLGTKAIVIRMIQAFLNPDLEVVGYGPNGAVLIDRRLAEAPRELKSPENGGIGDVVERRAQAAV
jgi:hypothetical protein